MNRSLAAWKSFWARVGGPESLTWPVFGLISVINPLGTVALYGGVNSPKFKTVFLIVLVAQLAVGLIWAIGRATVLPHRPRASRPIVMVLWITLIGVTRSIVLDYLIVKWGIDESILAKRMYSNVVYGLFWAIFGAVVMDYYAENKRGVRTIEESIKDLIQEGSDLIKRIEESQTFASRELALEINETLRSLDELIVHESTTESEREQVNNLREVIMQLQDNQEVTQSLLSEKQLFSQDGIPTRVFMRSSLLAAMHDRPFIPSASAFVGYTGAAAFLSIHMTKFGASQYALAISALFFVIQLASKKWLAPVMKKSSTVKAFFLFEIATLFVVGVVTLFGYATITENGMTRTMASSLGLNAYISLHIFTMTSGVLTDTRRYRHELIVHKVALETAVHSLIARESELQRHWEALFQKNIADTPTAATVMLREYLDGTQAIALEHLLPKVTQIWISVEKSLRLA